MPLPLLVFDTNILLDVWLGRENDQAILLVRLAETNRVELLVPEYVLIEFRGTALRWVRDETARVQVIRAAAKEWLRSQELGTGADNLRASTNEIETKLTSLASQVGVVETRIRPQKREIELDGVHRPSTRRSTSSVRWIGSTSQACAIRSRA